MIIQLESTSGKVRPRRLFYSYAHKDELLRDELDAHLSSLKREGFISEWHDRKIRAGDEWEHAIDENLNSAEVILFLVSPHFLASAYCRDIEVKQAMKRHMDGLATVVPIILKPCIWTNEEFARLEPLPKTGRPISEWPDSGFAVIAEELRNLLVDLNYPRTPDRRRDGMHGSWVLKVRDNGASIDRTTVESVVERLKDLTGDYSIYLQATARTRVADGEEITGETVLVLSGSPEAFVLVDAAKQKGGLSAALGVEVVSFYMGYGAVVRAASEPHPEGMPAVSETGDLLMRPGRKVSPCVIKGIKVNDREPTKFDFIVDGGDSSIEEVRNNGDFAKQIGYFTAALTVREENMWVNLSAYEADRMLPEPLAGTRFGRDLLAKDVVLKQFASSLMHPDSPVGRTYWKEVFARARHVYGTTNRPFNSFQKVWVVPKKAVVYEMPLDQPQPEVLERFGIENGERFAYIVESELDTLCECDLVAQEHHAASQSRATSSAPPDFEVDVFREIVLPHIHREVNESEHFAELRQIYHALILATWYKKKLRDVSAYEAVFNSVDTDNPGSLRPTIRSIARLGGSDRVVMDNAPESLRQATRSALDHATPDAAAFQIADNVEFYGRYLKLFRDGVFRCARSEAGDNPGERIVRVYFSGAIRLQSLGLEVTPILAARQP
jgi:hypothetical protein